MKSENKQDHDEEIRIAFDKCTAVLHVGICHKEIEANVNKLAQTLAEEYGLRLNQITSKKNSYKYNLTLPLSQELNFINKQENKNKPKMFIQVKSTYGTGKRPFIRFELSGYPLSRADYYIARRWLETIIGTKALLILTENKIKVTRIDIAHDFPQPIDELYFNFKRSMTSAVYYSKLGTPETFYFSIGGVERKLVVYSLKAKRKRYKLPDEDGYSTRAELRHKIGCMLSELPKKLQAQKYIDRIEVFDPAFLDDEAFPQLMKNHFAHAGTKATLQALPSKQRRKIRAVMGKHRIPVLDLNDIDTAIQKELKRLRNLLPEHAISARLRRKYERIFKSHLSKRNSR